MDQLRLAARRSRSNAPFCQILCQKRDVRFPQIADDLLSSSKMSWRRPITVARSLAHLAARKAANRDDHGDAILRKRRRLLFRKMLVSFADDHYSMPNATNAAMKV